MGRGIAILAPIAALGLMACGGGADCGPEGVCGCPVEATLTVSTTVTDAAGPLGGVEVYCDDEMTPVATSGVDGSVSFTIDVVEMPGCGYDRCQQVVFRDPTGAHLAAETTPFSANDGPVVLARAADAG